ncbi:quinohemoprotein amine dehydrogenase subunit beta [Albidovulum sediminis]|uniref:Quinohemoprotein amine dehydrogenase subunit beta n=1 Tax=Albidovulum sediminis TaxID=3066345 RepID=A0ABT2NGM4_9RHOB|nr:quinohemoprotein amine dehydrogenase subunit beta [Defluviimonas sediminis]MCT8328061.1 quinohemoprotein amine dehydrogenase subunit beta [Defluviimonas sediminis]
MKTFLTGLSLALAGVLAPASGAEARDLLVTVARPDNLYVIDAASRTVIKDCTIGAEHPSPGVTVMSPDGRIAYMLLDRWQNVVGVNIETCERVFFARQSEEKVIRRSIASLAVSRDGTRLYTVRNPVRHHPDHYEVMEPEFAVFDTAAGLDAKPLAIHPAPRRSTLMAADDAGTVYIAGHDVFAVNPETGDTSVAIANANWDRPTYSGPDVLAFWPIGTQNDEFMLLYSAAVFTDEKKEEMADFVWGYESVDLKTGETEIKDFASFEVIMFSAVRNPNAENELYGVYTQLSKHDVATGELIKRVDLPHTYYVINISSDGKEVYVGGTNSDIGVYDTSTLERIGEIQLPSGGDMSVSTLQIVQAE